MAFGKRLARHLGDSVSQAGPLPGSFSSSPGMLAADAAPVGRAADGTGGMALPLSNASSSELSEPTDWDPDWFLETSMFEDDDDTGASSALASSPCLAPTLPTTVSTAAVEACSLSDAIGTGNNTTAAAAVGTITCPIAISSSSSDEDEAPLSPARPCSLWDANRRRRFHQRSPNSADGGQFQPNRRLPFEEPAETPAETPETLEDEEHDADDEDDATIAASLPLPVRTRSPKPARIGSESPPSLPPAPSPSPSTSSGALSPIPEGRPLFTPETSDSEAEEHSPAQKPQTLKRLRAASVVPRSTRRLTKATATAARRVSGNSGVEFSLATFFSWDPTTCPLFRDDDDDDDDGGGDGDANGGGRGLASAKVPCMSGTMPMPLPAMDMPFGLCPSLNVFDAARVAGGACASSRRVFFQTQYLFDYNDAEVALTQMSRDASKYLSYYDITVTVEDVRAVRQRDWLTDNNIAFWETYLEHEVLSKYPEARIHLMRPSLSQMLAVLSTDEIRQQMPRFRQMRTSHIFIPVNNSRDLCEPESGSHWSLLLVSVIDGVAFHYDSLGGANIDPARRLTARLANLLEVGLRFRNIDDTPMQDNSSDCGVFVCVLMRFLLVKRLLNAHAREKVSMSLGGKMIDADGGRKEMIKTIENLRREAERRRSTSPFVKQDVPRIE